MTYIISPPEDAALQAHLQKLRTQLHEDPELSWYQYRQEYLEVLFFHYHSFHISN